MLTYLMLIPVLYTASRYLLWLPLPMPVKVLLVILLVMIAQCHTFYHLLFGNRFAPEFPRAILIVINWLYGALLLFTVLLLLADVISALVFLVSRHWLMSLAAMPYLLIATLLLSAWAVWQAIKVPEIKQQVVKIKHLPDAFRGYRLVQLTDLHASPLLNQHWMQKVVNKTNQLKPDLILMTGDIADGPVTKRAKDVAPLAELQAIDGKFAIVGNHEYYSDYETWIKKIDQLGFRLLLNQSACISRSNDDIYLAGLTDDAALHYAKPGPDLPRALQQIPENKTIILMDHRPTHADDNAKAGVSLQLSGHTHGGMIYGLDKIVQKANRGWYSGLYQVATMQLYVSNGTGLWNGFSLRLGHPSEITLLILEPT